MTGPAFFRLTQCPGGKYDARLRRMTSVFGHRNGHSIANPEFVARHDDNAVFLDQRTGIWYPQNRATTDGWGRQVADVNHTDPVPEEEYLF